MKRIVRDHPARIMQWVAACTDQQEYQLYTAIGLATDLIIYGMLKSECRFLEGEYHAALLASLRA